MCMLMYIWFIISNAFIQAMCLYTEEKKMKKNENRWAIALLLRISGSFHDQSMSTSYCNSERCTVQ